MNNKVIVILVAGVIGLLMGGLVTGFTLAVMLNNAGGAWDNAKKYIEANKLQPDVLNERDEEGNIVPKKVEEREFKAALKMTYMRK